ncbi:MAG: DUF302 domain-containing protein [Sulfurimonadaceae bacterium]|jgi:uncharacterized protein (DUF302 family)|nr:DUF302 domain-containing protein [Sulfurimonadaceae bacterium]
MRKIILFFAAIACAITLQAKGDLHTFAIENKNGAITPETIEKAFTSNGFTLGINSEMNYPFEKQFQTTDYKVFTLMTLLHTKLSPKLLNTYPQAGVFSPMGVGIYQAKNEDTIHLSFLTKEAHAKILNMNDPLLKEIEDAFLAVVKKSFPKAKYTNTKQPLVENRSLITQYELEIGDDWEGAKEEFEMSLESGFEPYGFVMPAYVDLGSKIEHDSSLESMYDFYVSYSICKLEVIYTVAKTHPEAAAFAPCTTMVYKKKDEDKIVVGFPAVYNWMSSALIDNPDALRVLQKAQDDFEGILKNITE